MSLDWKEKLEHEQKEGELINKLQSSKVLPIGQPASNFIVLSTYILEFFTKLGIVIVNYIHLSWAIFIYWDIFAWFFRFFWTLKKIKKNYVYETDLHVTHLLDEFWPTIFSSEPYFTHNC